MLVASLALSSTALAQTIPYQGTLELDGSLVSGTVWMEVSIVRDDGGVPDPAGACWGAVPTDRDCFTTLPFEVDVIGGRFELELGSDCVAGTPPGGGACGATTLDGTPWVTGDEVVYVHLRVGETDTTMVPLAGAQRLRNRQRLGFAVSSPDATEVLVESDLRVDGALVFPVEVEGGMPAVSPEGRVNEVAVYLDVFPSWIGTLVTLVMDAGTVRFNGNLTVGNNLSTESLAVTNGLPISDAFVQTDLSGTTPVDAFWSPPDGMERSACFLERTYAPVEALSGTVECDVDALTDEARWRLEATGTNVRCSMRCLAW